jgi:hypothetical protein
MVGEADRETCAVLLSGLAVRRALLLLLRCLAALRHCARHGRLYIHVQGVSCFQAGWVGCEVLQERRPQGIAVANHDAQGAGAPEVGQGVLWRAPLGIEELHREGVDDV